MVLVEKIIRKATGWRAAGSLRWYCTCILIKLECSSKLICCLTFDDFFSITKKTVREALGTKSTFVLKAVEFEEIAIKAANDSFKVTCTAARKSLIT